MSSVNKVILIGHLGADPEMRYTATGDAMCSFSLATSERWKDKTSGELRDQTEWHRITLFRRQAEVAGQYLKKGSQIYLEGSLHTRKWTDKEGVERYTTEIRGNNMTMLGSRQGMGDPMSSYPSQGSAPAGMPPAPLDAAMPAPAAANRKPASFDDLDDDIPF